MKTSVLIATYNRARFLMNCLVALSEMNYSGIEWQVVVADNNSTDDTAQVARRFSDRIPTLYCFEPKQGKNAALNRALEHADGELLLFIDDDVLVDRNWLLEWTKGVERWPERTVFGGPILPLWPSEVPTGIRAASIFESAYGILNLEQPEGVFSTGRPWGGNMGLRREVLPGTRPFNEDVGPTPGAYVMGSEADLLCRLAQMGYEAIYLPEARVRHVIRPEQLKWKWLLGRAYRRGKGLAHLDGETNVQTVFGIPRYLIPMFAHHVLNCVRLACLRRKDALSALLRVFEVAGRMTQARNMARKSLAGKG